MMKRVVVVGTGYVGLPAALLLARAGHPVLAVDLNENIVRAINDGVLLIAENELKSVMEHPAVRENLRASTGVEQGDVYLIAVPTPVHPRKKVADLSYVASAMESIVPHLKPGALIILESTVPPLTCKEVLAPMIREKTGLRVPEDVMVAHCPERILPGDIFYEIVHNDRIIGGMDKASSEAAREVYASFVEGELLMTDDVTAELCKLMENTYRDVNIALANEMSEVAKTLGVDWKEAFSYANRHPRVSYLSPGIGVGGHCIPIDPWFIREVDPINCRLIELARRINDGRPHQIAASIRRSLADIPDPRVVAIGAAYKADTEDKRESPALEVVAALREDGYRVDHYDPHIKGMEIPSLVEAVKGADFLAILVNHGSVRKELAENRQAVEAAMRTPRIVVY
jgi:UDP-N-acetyl-D-mannosaminuronic acid dehydrogenase